VSARSKTNAEISAFISARNAGRAQRYYGSPRWSAELLAAGVQFSRPHVERVMRGVGLSAARRKTCKATTDSKHQFPVAANVLDRNLSANAPDQAWVPDITHIRTKGSWLYLTAVKDLWSRGIIGWSFSSTPKTNETALPALRMAAGNGRPSVPVVFHSDRGIQNADRQFSAFCSSHGITRSMS
jgi:putative transposase